MRISYASSAGKILLVFFQIVSQYAGGCINPPWPNLYLKIARKFDVSLTCRAARARGATPA